MSTLRVLSYVSLRLILQRLTLGTTMNIKPYDTRIQKLFQSAFFRIPRFQRPYSWDRGNIEDFWSDIVDSGKSNHFIGSMVFYTQGNDQELFIVDGQQRLTTITVFLAAIRDALAEWGENDLANGIQNFLERPDISSQNRFVLKTETSAPYFQDFIQKHGKPELELDPSDEEKGLSVAYNFIKQNLDTLIGEIEANESSLVRRKKKIRERLATIRDSVLSLDVIVVQLDNEQDAHNVFETLNVRGRDLEPKDLIKNLIMKLLPAKSVDLDHAKIRWNKMLQSLSGSSATLDPSSYLTHYWLSLHDYTTKATLYEHVKRWIGKDNAKSFLEGIAGDVDSYRRIFEPDAYDWKKEEEDLKKSLHALNVFKMAQPAPFLLSVLRRYSSANLSLKQTRTALGAVERFHFAYTAIAGQSSSGGTSKMYAAAAQALSSEQDVQKAAKLLQEFQSKLFAKFPEENSFVSGFFEIRFSQAETKNRALTRYILEEVDARVRKSGPIDYRKMTIEHIAPQNPQSGVPPQNFSSIGNLIFVDEDTNLKLKNKSFEDKIFILQQANVPLDSNLAQANKWGTKEIEDRTRALASLLYTSAKSP